MIYYSQNEANELLKSLAVEKEDIQGMNSVGFKVIDVCSGPYMVNFLYKELNVIYINQNNAYKPLFQERMRKILLNLGKEGDIPNGFEWIINGFKNGEFPIHETQLDEWAIKFHPNLPDFRKLLFNFESVNITSILKKVYQQHCTNDMKAMYEMFG